MEKRVEIDPGVVNYLEALSYETQGRKEVLAFLAERGVGPGEPVFQDYHAQCMEYFAERELVKAQIERDYILPATGGRPCRWRIDFIEGSAVVTEAEHG